MIKYLMIFVILLSISCAEPCYVTNMTNVTDYAMGGVTHVTTHGFKVHNRSGMPVDLYRVEEIIAYAEYCTGIRLKKCVEILIPEDVYISPCSGEQLFPCNIVDVNGFDVCRVNKKLHTTEECPCNCRSATQDDNLIVTTPNLVVFGQEVVRLLTGELNPWENYSHCIL